MLCSQTERIKYFKQPEPLTECVYNLIEKPDTKHDKPLRYQSQYKTSLKEFYDSVKHSHKTMGYVKNTLANPAAFLKKHSRDIKLDKTPKPFTYPDKEYRKAPVPKASDKSKSMTDDKRNFIKDNIKDATRRPAVVPARNIVETSKGDVFELEPSGCVPKYCNKVEYGKIPKYLEKRNADMEYSHQKYQQFLEKECLKTKPLKMPEQEREELLNGMKLNWKKLNSEYLRLPLCTDTIKRRENKLTLEKQLKNLEMNIELLERHEEMYVYDAS